MKIKQLKDADVEKKRTKNSDIVNLKGKFSLNEYQTEPLKPQIFF